MHDHIERTHADPAESTEDEVEPGPTVHHDHGAPARPDVQGRTDTQLGSRTDRNRTAARGHDHDDDAGDDRRALGHPGDPAHDRPCTRRPTGNHAGRARRDGAQPVRPETENHQPAEREDVAGTEGPERHRTRQAGDGGDPAEQQTGGQMHHRGHGGTTDPRERPPAVRPHTMTGPAAGTASRLAGSAASGNEPNTGMRTGATPIWAAVVTPMRSAITRGPGRRSATGRASTMMPADAPTDSWKPTEVTRSGSMSRSAVTARASVRRGLMGEPTDVVTVAMRAMAVARRTDGSRRVANAKKTNSPMATPRRQRGPSRRSTGPAATRTNATFSPDTARRCERPDARKSSMTSADSARSSPKTRPVKRGCWSSGSTSAPSASRRRNPLAARAAGPPSSISRTERASTVPTMWRRTSQGVSSGRGATSPSIVTTSPASRRASPPRPDRAR